MIARADGTVTRQIDGGWADWSPDGRSIAFTSANGELRVLELEGGKVRTLARGGAGSPSWSPDGRKIAFSVERRPATVNADGSDQRQVPVEGVDEFEFWSLDEIDWSPNGLQFVVSVELEPHTTTELYTLPVAGGRLHQITHDGTAVGPRWSPDGRWIVYANDGAIYSSRGDSIVKLVRPDGSGQHRLAPPETAFGWRTRDPAWKDASTVVYSAWRPYSSYLRNIELHTIRIDRTHERRLTYHCQFGSQKADTWLTGTYLDDIIYPGGGTDRVRTGPGGDVVHARGGGRDTIDCGSGKDTVFADRRDLVTRDCERVRRY
jgi:WD40 repeat protein